MRGAFAAVLGAALLAACTGPPAPAARDAYGAPVVSFLTDDLLQVQLDIAGVPDAATLRDVTDCAAAEAMVLKGSPFARHVRTTVVKEAGISRADAVYSVSPTLPAGRFTMDAQTILAACRDRERERV